MSDGMMERVAEALYRDEPYCLVSGGRPRPLAWFELAPSGKERYMVRARAAIEAMREPSDAMIAEASGDHFWDEIGPTIVWENMIDAALNDPKPPSDHA